MLILALDLSLAIVALSMALCFLRLVLGPSPPDRILAMDTLAINAIAFLIVLGLRGATSAYFEVALLIAMLGFVGTVAFAKYLLRGSIIE
jgi:multicomponent K+:H+ antiporter subunit F